MTGFDSESMTLICQLCIVLIRRGLILVSTYIVQPLSVCVVSSGLSSPRMMLVDEVMRNNEVIAYENLFKCDRAYALLKS